MELKRGVSINQWRVEDHPFALVVHQTGNKGRRVPPYPLSQDTLESEHMRKFSSRARLEPLSQRLSLTIPQ
jgi:hypothetical protein